MGAAALIVTLLRAIHSHSAQADLQNASNKRSAHEGQIIPSRLQGILGCSLPVSDCERTIVMVPMSLKFSPREIG